MAQLFLFMMLILSSARASLYSLADLQVLEKDGAYNEFFDHALDIKPSERLGPWKEMVSRMADVFSRTALTRTEIRATEFRRAEDLFQWPPLKGDDLFKARRLEIGLRFLKQCLKADKPCWDELKGFWEADKTDADTAFKLAELMSLRSDSPLPLWTFLEVALRSPLSAFFCRKDFAMRALWEKIEIDYVRLGHQGNLTKKIDETVHPECLTALNEVSRNKLLSPEKSMDRELAFQILRSQGKDDQKTSDFFFTVYLLERPSQGELFNFSWNRLKELGAKSTRRDALLEELKRLDPLPDAIIGSIDLPKKQAVLNHFKQNFPEYLDYYSRQCVLFYGGKSSFPHGNPTVHCQDLMGSDFASDLIGPSKLNQYQEARKI